jgi:hypothetical protein
MKRIASLCLLTFFCVGAGILLAAAQTSTDQDQPLGQYARDQKKNRKPAAHTYDNDNIPTQDSLGLADKSTHATEAQGASEQNSSPEPAAEGETVGKPPAEGKHAVKVEKMPEVDAGQSAEDRQRVFGKWQDKLGEQQQKLDLATRELDVMQREYKLRAVDFYADAGNRLRNQADWDKQDAEYKKQLEEKQKAVADAKAEMENTQEEARKAGVPNSVTEKAVTEKPQE